jgi:hypothetical protein
MVEVWIDPSYTGTGICALDPEKKTIVLALLSREARKAHIMEFFKASLELKAEMRAFIDKLSSQCVVYMETPFHSGISSASLYMLQTAYLLEFTDCEAVTKTYAIAPSWISPNVKKVCESKDERKFRKGIARTYINNLIAKGYQVFNYSLLTASGDDVATAVLFMVLSKKLAKKWPVFIDKG